MQRLLYPFIEALFRVLFTYDCLGEEQVPAAGPAVVAANHPSYLDPVLLSLQVARPIRFMAWDALFRVPLLGALIRAFGAFPVDVRKGKGREAFERAKALVLSGEVVGIFPEGQRSHTGWMETRLREGAARLALETGAPLVPATIAGAFRAWPYYQALPRPARIRVRFHPPIDPLPYRAQPEEAALEALLAELRRRVERSLLPGVKADLRLHLLYRLPPSGPRGFELLPPVALAALLLARTGDALTAVPSLAYLAYLLADRVLMPQSRLTKWLRSGSAALFCLAAAPFTLARLGLAPIPASAALGAIALGALFPYLYERRWRALEMVRGFSFACLLELAALLAWPTPAGPHLALPLFGAAFAWDRRTVFWRPAVAVLLAYALGVPRLLGADPLALAPHAAVALLAWAATRVLPAPRGASSAVGLGIKP